MILSGAMLLRHVGEGDRASAIESAVDTVLERGEIRTPDLGGGSTTREVVEAIAAEVRAA
jgi:isocitrate/isopropylmalate dehydrogenase